MAALMRLLVVLLLVVMHASPLHAEPGHRAVRLDYSAEPGCPDRSAFFELVRLRASAVELADTGEHGRRFTVSLEKDAQHQLYRGRLGEPGDAGEVTRTLEGASCEEVARGVALVIAVQLGPAGSEPEASPSSRPRTMATPPRAPPRIPEKRLSFELAVLGGASVGLTSSIGSRAAPTVQGGVELRSISGPWFVRPSLRLAISVARAPEMQDREGTVDATLGSALLRACPLAVPGLGPRLSIEPCATIELGRLFSTGRTPRAELTTSSPWTAVGGAAHMLTWVNRSVFIEADLVIFAPLDRYRPFLTSPERPLFETPEVGVRWCIGGGVRFL